MESPTSPTQVTATRRGFFRKFARAALFTGVAASLPVVYGFFEASQIRIRRQTLTLPKLPHAFEGKTLGVLTDFHNGPYVSMDFIRKAIDLAQTLNADCYCLVGDFAHKGTHALEQLPECLEACAKLEAPLGVFAVPGNHDMQNKGQVYRESIAKTSLTDLTNKSMKLTIGSDSLWLAGVDDLWWGKPDVKTALAGVPRDAEVILLSHNPDYAEEVHDPRVSLILSGHTHGGQVYLPVVGSPWMPSRFGEKYRNGLASGPSCPVFVSRGLGEAGVPLRLNCPPEIHLLTLTRG
jgi:uncharacterized protein